MRFALVVAALLLAGCGGLSQSADHGSQWLVLEFPFGPGVSGAIQGTARPGPLINEAYLLVQVRRCGAENPFSDAFATHLVTITERSSARDRPIVECLKRTLPVDFSAATGWGSRWSPQTLDPSKFADFATSPAIKQSAR